jgi:hypothetical protein
LVACCSIAFFGELGPEGTGDSGIGGVEVWAGVVAGGVYCGVWAPGEEENLEEKLDNHEFRRDGLAEGELDFGRGPFNVTAFSVDELLEKPGRCAGIGFGAAGSCS